MTSETLLPCPFCGGPAEIWRAHKEPYARKAWIACMGNCGGQRRGTVLTTEYETDAEAVAAWNTRSLPAALDRVIAEVEVDERDHFKYTTPASNGNDFIWRCGKEHLMGILRALRAAETAPETQDE